jgi:ribosomal protein L11 methylase PrmA
MNSLQKTRRLIDSLHPPIFSYILEVKKQLQGSRSILDVGCGMRPSVSYVACDYTVGIDLNPYALEIANDITRQIHYVSYEYTSSSLF